MAPKKGKEPEKKLVLGRMKGNLKMGLVGLPNVGKSSTFNVLCKQTVLAENYPFCTIDSHEARVNDSRFKWLCENFHPKSEVPANLTVFDIAGLVPGAHKGEGLGNVFLSHIQAVDGTFHVVRAFEEDVVHTEGEVNPINDMITITNELRLKDVDRLQGIIVERKKNRLMDKSKKIELEILENILKFLDSGKWISQGHWKTNEIVILNEHYFLTAKPVVYLVNMCEKDFIRQKNKWLGKIATWVKENNPGPIVPYSAQFESKLAAFGDDEHKRQEFLKLSGVTQGAIDKIVSTGYKTLGLIHYFTCGKDEVKCWTIREGTKAPQAAGIIHTDFEKGFICADVYKFDDLVTYKTEAALKLAGKIVQRGKDYVVEDGDIIFFKFNPSGGGSNK